MHVGLVIAGDLEQTSGGYRYDRKLVEYLERQGDTVDVLSLPPRAKHNGGDESVDLDESIRSQLNQPYDVLIEDELCYPTLLKYNPDLDAPDRIVSLVHLLESAGPSVTDPQRHIRERRYLESVDAAICTSEFTRDRTTDCTALPTAVVPPAGRHETAAVSAATVNGRARATPLHLVFVGNVIPRKNLETVVSALETLSQDTEWELTVVGSTDAAPEYVAEQRNRVERAGLTTRVTFAGHVTDERLESILERAHVLAVPSRYEGFGMVYLEAMEYGVIPIASAVGGASELVTDGENGSLIDPDNVERLAKTIEVLERDRDQLAALGQQARATAVSQPTWDEQLATFRAVLNAWHSTEESQLASATPTNTRGGH
ncbi:glycosyltransferase family 4 protein [Natronolimnobius sp. AArcel1]|uniref:glycosyltransferase family 4 protein n=1 Tax=Natronolimnobius sp. AArcel1 TaxID=1679093 RepID=UPI0013EBC305|nr:glycosyltransferase family 4 protein [Natronolimnobius sp. AArcel1]NGM70951.1 glycosyltransferase family 4 protein [Natronolimnobius sp. AArcel1]